MEKSGNTLAIQERNSYKITHIEQQCAHELHDDVTLHVINESKENKEIKIDTKAVEHAITSVGEGYESYLSRKHEWESTTKKASNRSWDKVYVVAKMGHLSFFKDQKGYKSNPELTFRGEPTYDLQGAVIQIAADYTKKKHVLRIKLSAGAEFLLQAHDDDEMNQWITILKAHSETATVAESRSQTLPATSQKDEPKRRSFFTLKKK